MYVLHLNILYIITTAHTSRYAIGKIRPRKHKSCRCIFKVPRFLDSAHKMRVSCEIEYPMGVRLNMQVLLRTWFTSLSPCDEIWRCRNPILVKNEILYSRKRNRKCRLQKVGYQLAFISLRGRAITMIRYVLALGNPYACVGSPS